MGLTGLQFDIHCDIKARVGLEIAEITVFLNYINSYFFALKNSLLKILENYQEKVHGEFLCLLNF